ncbi:MAG: phosphotriesterase, partial [Gammaproteobacteria bacterium]
TEGRVSVDQLGRTLVHEHVAVGFPGWYLDVRQPKYKREDALAQAVDHFAKLRDYGVRTVVDPCPMDLGRDVELVALVAQKTGLNLVCATGMYAESMGISYSFARLPVEAIVEIYVKEIEDGIAWSGIRAGVIKIATGDGSVTDFERKALTAAARAARITGLPLISHTENATCGHDQIDIITGEGVPAQQLLVGHSDGRDDHAYHVSIAERGAYVGFDRFGLEMIVPDEVRVQNVKRLVEAGYRDHVMMSHDTVHCFLGGLPGGMTHDEFRTRLPNWRLTHIFENIFPRLRALGVSQEDLDHIVTDNPRRFFTAGLADTHAPHGAHAH